MPLTKVSAGVIAANAVQDSVGSQSITGDKLGLTAINANNIVNASITGAKIALGTITGDDIATGQITGNLLTANCISGNNIVASVILTTPIISGNLNLDSAGTTGVRVPSANTIAFHTAGTEDMRIDSSGNLLFNSGYGSVATAYGCRAWVNFNGQGTPAIRASGNVSSLTDDGTGNYYINFSTSMPDTNYSLSGATAWIAGVEPSGIVGQSNGTMETGRCGIVVLSNGSDTTVDLPRVYAVIHR